MARPIEPTPKLTGDDAKALLESLSSTASAQVIAQRQAQAEKRLARVLEPTSPPSEQCGDIRDPK